MGLTNYDALTSATTNVKVGTEAARPTTPLGYYGGVAGQEAGSDEWKGGELYFASDTHELHNQTATSGKTPTWRKLDDAFATTTSSSTTTSTTTSSSSTTSSTTTSTTTSSTTSTSTSTSSTTTP